MPDAKRKRGYAVRNGPRPGIYEDWNSAEAAIRGVSGAQHRSFATLSEAQAWLAGVEDASGAVLAPARQLQEPPLQQQQQLLLQQQSQKQQKQPGGKVYAVRRGRRTGVFTAPWSEVQQHVIGVPGAQYKGFATVAEAQNWLDYGRTSGKSSEQHEAKRSRATAELPLPPPQTASASEQQHAGQQQGAPQQQQSLQSEPQQVLQPAANELMVTVFFDGGSRSNPGRAGYGYVIYERTFTEQARAVGL